MSTNENTPTNNKKRIININTRHLFIFCIAIVACGIGGTAVSLYNGTHWMEAPGIAIMVLFMPMTAISYLHYRLPKKQEEYNQVKSILSTSGNSSELFSLISNPEETSTDYLLPIFFVTFLSFLGFYILFSNLAVVLFNGMAWVELAANKSSALAASGTALHMHDTESFRRSLVATGMAFLGAYIWSVQYVFRRMMTLDLPPGAYYSVGSRMIFSIFLAVIFQHFMAGAGPDFEFGNQLIVVSFLIGIFPERALTWLREQFAVIFVRKKNMANPLPLEMIEGVSNFHKARLQELGIDNVQNLAHASLMELMIKTPFRPRTLVDWMAQARLCQEFKENTTAIRSAGIRTILDLQEAADDAERVKSIAENAGVKLSVIETVIRTNSQEESLNRLRKAYDALNLV